MLRYDEATFNQGSGVLQKNRGAKKHAQIFDHFPINCALIVFQSSFEVGENVEIAVTDGCPFDIAPCDPVPDVEVAGPFWLI